MPKNKGICKYCKWFEYPFCYRFPKAQIKLSKNKDNFCGEFKRRKDDKK